MAKHKVSKTSAIVINESDEQFMIVNTQTTLSSCNKMVVGPLDDSEIGHIRRAGFSISLSRDTVVERNEHFDGIKLLIRDKNKEFNYSRVDMDVYDISGLSHPLPTVATFSGGYTSRDGCFVVSCNNKERRVLYVGGKLDRGHTRLTSFGHPSKVAKAMQSICTTYPEIRPPVMLDLVNEYGENQQIPVYGQHNLVDSAMAFEVKHEIFDNAKFENTVNGYNYAVVRFELPKIPNGTCSQQVIAIL